MKMADQGMSTHHTVFYHGVWTANGGVSERLVRHISQQLSAAPPLHGNLTLTHNHLSLRVCARNGTQIRINSIAFSDLRDVIPNKFNPMCLMVIYQNNKNGYSILVCTNRDERKILDICRAFRDYLLTKDDGNGSVANGVFSDTISLTVIHKDVKLEREAVEDSDGHLCHVGVQTNPSDIMDSQSPDDSVNSLRRELQTLGWEKSDFIENRTISDDEFVTRTADDGETKMSVDSDQKAEGTPNHVDSNGNANMAEGIQEAAKTSSADSGQHYRSTGVQTPNISRTTSSSSHYYIRKSGSTNRRNYYKQRMSSTSSTASLQDQQDDTTVVLRHKKDVHGSRSSVRKPIEDVYASHHRLRHSGYDPGSRRSVMIVFPQN